MPKKPLQPGEIEAEAKELNAQTIGEQLAEIREKSEKEKIPLSKEMEEYTRANLRKVQDKLAAGESVYPADMEFIGKVKWWMEMPQAWREKYESIEKMEASVEVQEAQKRNIDLRQWAALMMMAWLKANKGEEIKWIDNVCQFPGNSKIEVAKGLMLIGCTGLTVLPDNLNVARYLNLRGCTGLTVLPDNLQVGGNLFLVGCTGLSVLPDNMRVGGVLDLRDCTGLTALPDNLHVAVFLHLEGCTGLTALPDNLQVGKDLYISKGAVEKIKRDAERLKKAGKIKGEIIFR